MSQIYKIYINQSILYISDALPVDILAYKKIDNQHFDFLNFLKIVENSTKIKCFLQSDDPKKTFKDIKKTCRLIKAAGGVVLNQDKEILFIFRNKKWDLPKGKRELGEKMKQAGIREVEEECGVVIAKAKKLICKTYHIYYIGSEVILKQTNWYRMRVKGIPKLIPQIDEGITKAIWASDLKIELMKKKMYPLILGILNQIDFTKKVKSV